MLARLSIALLAYSAGAAPPPLATSPEAAERSFSSAKNRLAEVDVLIGTQGSDTLPSVTRPFGFTQAIHCRVQGATTCPSIPGASEIDAARATLRFSAPY